MRLRNRFAVFTQSFEMQFNRFADIALNLLDGVARSGTAGQIGKQGRKIVIAMLDDNCVLSHGFPLRPAWTRTLPRVRRHIRAGMTWPRHAALLYSVSVLALPRVRTCRHPSCSIRRM